MKRTFLFFLCIWMSSFALNGQVIINEILPGGTVELKNIGTSTVNVSSYWLCDFPAYQQIQNSEVICGDMMLPAGEILAVNNFATIDEDDGEMGLYSTSNFGSANAILDYVEWGSTGHTRSNVAVAAGIWTAGDFVPEFAPGSSLEYDGDGDASTDWAEQETSTICEENGGAPTCDALGGTIEGGPFEFCVGDGVEDNVSGITLSGNDGMNSQWVVTDEQGTILGLPPMPSVVNFDGAGPGTCLIWHLSYDDGLSGLEVDMNTGDLDGCFEFSNSIAVVRNQPEGGTLEGGPFEFCVGDGVEDNVSGITLSGNAGPNSQWVVTDEQGTILGLPPMPSAVNFDGAGPGTCLIWHLSYEDGLGGLEVDMNTGDLDGCYNFSNSIAVVRNQPEGGMLQGGPFEFCVGDGVDDNVSGIALTGNSGTNSQWVVTDDQGNILGLPPMPSAVNFDGAGPGTCLIWHLSFEDGLQGAEVGMNANDLAGCYSLSNPITVVRNQPEGGTLEGGPFEFCVGDDIQDNVSGITLTGNSGTNSQWVVTDDQGNILGLPPMPSAVNFDGAGPGTCLIWHLSFEDGLQGAEVGLNANDLEGCYSLSNPIAVVRLQPEGGTLEGGRYEFCVNDGVEDNVSGITLTGNTGTNSQWVVTDDQGNILGLPPMPSAVNFDGAGAGVCLIWHLSFEDGLQGAEVGMNANDLAGCYDLSNPVTVYRFEDPNCDDLCVINGGYLDGEDYTFCVDGEADNVSNISLSGNTGSNSAWVVTDEQGNILGLPPTPEAVNFDGAGPGVCLIWHLSFEDGLQGAEVGMNAADLEGCYDLSNSIRVVRNQPIGGTLEGGRYEFCVNDGIEDNVSGIILTGNSGTNSQWVVTDEQGNILGLPPMPGVVNFDGAGAGVCLIWNLSYEDGLQGAEVGMNANNLEGCFDLSNPITVYRFEDPNCEDLCVVNGGYLDSEDYVFCVDGQADNVSEMEVSGNSGSNSAWVITDEQGNILGLPPSPDVVNFDDAGVGVCLIWHLSFEDGLQGAEVGMNAADLEGCFDLSNPIRVTRQAPDGGMVSLTDGSTEYTGTAGDIVFDVQHTTTATSLSYWYIITDNNDNILGWLNSADGNTLDLSVAPPGECHVWGWSYRGLGDPVIGENISTLTDDFCEAISDNFITVTRLEDNCPAEGGTIEGGPFEFCVGDGIDDNVSGITLTGNSGMNSQWVVTDDQGNILGLPPMPSAVNFDGAGPGTCLIWHLSFEDGLEGAEVGMNAADLEGCYSLSNPITVVRNQPEGGTLEGGPFEFCVGDGIDDNVSGITLSGNSGTNSQWVVTDDQGNILGLPPMPSAVNFDGAGPGTCLIWHLSFEDGLEGAEVGMNAADLEGCYSLSNPITVVRNQPEGGTLEGGPFEFCVGDGIDDNVSGITLSGNSGTNSQWVVTDDQGNILGLPPMPSAVNFDGAGPGTCLIWHLSFEDGLQGAEVGMNAADLEGCYSLSNPITVVRNQPEGGTLEGGPFEFCVGDGIDDNVSGITLSGNSGTNSQWVVTDDQGNILGLPPMPSAVNFDGAGPGTCLIWHLSFEDGLQGAEVGMNAADLEGCYSLSNPITVVRLTGDDCNTACTVEGGTIEGGPFEFCVGDGIDDNVSGITLSGNSGMNSQWVVTDDQGNILGLPPMPSAVNFDGAGPGTCLIWHLSFEDGLQGAEVGMNAADLEGCYSLSNPITVVRNQPEGGTLEGGPFEFCVGDGIDDNVSGITLSGNSGTNSQWVVTDDQGNILGLPPMPSAVNFDGAGPGTCLIWHLSFEDGLQGAEVGMNAADLEGCYSLSNPITVVRNQPEGGTLEGGPFEFCVGDGIDDNVSGITLSGNSGTNSQWVVTDDQGNILGLPPMPSAVNFDGAGPGTCLIWHLSFEDGLQGAEVGMNAADLEGCYSLSNPITVVRNQPEGGTLEGGPFEFCVGDGIDDNVSGITLSGNSGTNSQWVVTDDQGNILGLPPMPSAVNFDGAGPGTCLIWHLSFEDGLQGAEVGMNAADLEGCYSLSNPITVVRNQPEGGTLEGGPFEFCVGDGIDDNVSGITLSGNSGTNSQWVVTDDQGNILGLPPMPSAVNFDGAGPGTCLIWHLSFEDGLQGAEVGMNAADLEGCYSLSNPITVVRLTGDDCSNNNDGVDLELSISVDNDTYDQYEHVTYTITATNNGTEDASNIVIEAGLPNGMVYSDDDPSAGEYSLFFEEWRLEELAAGESETLELVLFTLVENVDIVNFVQVLEQDQDDVDSTPGNGNGVTPQEDDEAAVTITPANPDPIGGTDADLSLTISVDEDTYDQYEHVTYTITLTNDGPDDATFIDVFAGLPDGMVYSDDDASHGEYSLFFEEWNIDFLESGETAVLELVLFTLVDDVDITNFVEVIASDQDDPDSTPDNGNGVTPQEDDEAAVTITFLESFAGSIQISGSSFTSSDNLKNESMNLFPVPTTDQLTVVLNAQDEELINAQVIDITGKVMSVNQFSIVNGQNKLELNVSDLPDGMYFLNISLSSGKVLNDRFQKIDR